MKNNKSLFLTGEIVRMDLGNGKIQIASKDSPKWEIWDNIDFGERVLTGKTRKEQEVFKDRVLREISELGEKSHDLSVIVFTEKLLKRLKKI